MKRGSGACDAPRLNARRFEEMVVEKIRSNILTEGNIRELVKLVDEEMDGVAHEQRVKLETVEAELADVRRRLERLYNLVETTDMDIDDFKPRIREHRERQERLEDAAADARAILSQRRAVLDDVNTIAAYAQDMSEFLNESELIERRAFIETFVKEIVVMPGDALMRYTIPISQSTPKTLLLLGGRSEEFREAMTLKLPASWFGMWTGDCTQKSSLTLSYGHLSSFSSRLTSSSNRFPQLQP